MENIDESSLEVFLKNIEHYLKYSDSAKISLERGASKFGLPEIKYLKKESEKRNYLMTIETEFPSKAIGNPVYGRNCEEGVIYHLKFSKNHKKFKTFFYTNN